MISECARASRLQTFVNTLAYRRLFESTALTHRAVVWVDVHFVSEISIKIYYTNSGSILQRPSRAAHQSLADRQIGSESALLLAQFEM